MAESASTDYSKFEDLKGAKNYEEWAECVKALAIRERTWNLLSGKTPRPSLPQDVYGKPLPPDAAGVKEELRKELDLWDQK